MRRTMVIAACLVLLLGACGRDRPAADTPGGASGGSGNDSPPPSEVNPDELPAEVRALWDVWDSAGPSTYTLMIGISLEPSAGGKEPCGLGFGLVEVTVIEDATVRALDFATPCDVDLDAPPEPLPLSVDAIFALVADHPGATANSGRGFGFPDYVAFETEGGFVELYVPSFREGVLDERLLRAPAVAYDGTLGVGRTYRYLVYLHCGMAWPAAFNGRAWHSEEAPPFATGGAPFPPEDWPLVDQNVNALVTLEDADTLVLEVVGTDVTVTYAPAAEGTVAPGCA